MARFLFVLLSLVAADAQAQAILTEVPSQLGFGYCAPPVVPSCIDAKGPRSATHASDACSRAVLRFTQTLGAYRMCLARESERAISTGNDAIARFRCRSQGGTTCR